MHCGWEIVQNKNNKTSNAVKGKTFGEKLDYVKSPTRKLFSILKDVNQEMFSNIYFLNSSDNGFFLVMSKSA